MVRAMVYRDEYGEAKITTLFEDETPEGRLEEIGGSKRHFVFTLVPDPDVCAFETDRFRWDPESRKEFDKVMQRIMESVMAHHKSHNHSKKNKTA